jgi:C4-dicarboxylate-specific signal transduction histidine kinase
VQWFGTSTDVEERRRAGEALHEAQAALAHVTRLTTLGELTASLAHELNQPLAAIVTNGTACLRWLGRDQPNVDEAVGAVQRMIRDGNRAAEVIAHTRALLRKSNEERVWVDIGALIRDVLVLVRPEVARHRIDVSLSLADDLPPVPADRIQLQQVVLNLIVNGIEAMADVTVQGRELGLAVEPSEMDGKPAVLVAVRDSGVGVMPEGLARLFEAFYTTKPDGLGMGLSISRSLIQAHGGRLWATRNSGHGLTFQFVIPVLAAP